MIVVDDASQDNTIGYLKGLFSTELASGQLKIFALKKNLGVTGAKNFGYSKASGDWVIFLDSDDEYYQDSRELIEAQLLSEYHRPLVFFRCRNQAASFIGDHESEERELDLKSYLRHTSYGEALTAINKSIVGEMLPYPSELRGYEGLGCCRLIKKYGPALLSKIIARTYYTEGNDRLSVSKELFKRMTLLARGNLIMINEFWDQMGLYKLIGYLIKALTYCVLGNAYKLIKKVS